MIYEIVGNDLQMADMAPDQRIPSVPHQGAPTLGASEQRRNGRHRDHDGGLFALPSWFRGDSEVRARVW